MAKFTNFGRNFKKENQVENKLFFIGNKKITLFYIDCLIDKPLFASSILNAIISAGNKAAKEKNKSVLMVLKTQILSNS